MFQRKLAAINYPRFKEFNAENNDQLKSLVIWLEDQKIRHYKIENRHRLNNAKAKKWLAAFEDYLKDLQSPFPLAQRLAAIDWLLGHAVGLEYSDNVEGFNSINASEILQQKEEPIKKSIHNISENDPVFKKGISNLANSLQIPNHDDKLLTLKAVRIVIEQRLSKQAIAEFDSDTENQNVVPIDKQELGFDLGDPVLNNAACALRLLHINELRKLQTDINNAIVAVQSITANPKTDERLGKVGRS